MHEEIRREKYDAERQVLLEEKEAAMREVQLGKTWCALQDHESAFMEYVADAEEEENVNISLVLFIQGEIATITVLNRIFSKQKTK